VRRRRKKQNAMKRRRRRKLGTNRRKEANTLVQKDMLIWKTIIKDVQKMNQPKSFS